MPDVWKIILGHLAPLDMTALAQTSKNFYALAWPDPENPNLSESDILGDVVDFALVPATEFFATTSRQSHALRDRYVSFLRIYKGGRLSFWTGAMFWPYDPRSVCATTNVLATELQHYQGSDWAHKTLGVFDPDFVTTAGAYMDALQSETRFVMPKCQDPDVAAAARTAVDAHRSGASGSKLTGVPIRLTPSTILRALRANFKNRRARFFAYVNVAPWLRKALPAPVDQIRRTARYLGRFKNRSDDVCWRFTGYMDDFAEHILCKEAASQCWPRPFQVIVSQDNVILPETSYKPTPAGRALAGKVEMLIANTSSLITCESAIASRCLKDPLGGFYHSLLDLFPRVQCAQSSTSALRTLSRLPRTPQETLALIAKLGGGDGFPGNALVLQEMTPHHSWNTAKVPTPSLCMTTASYNSSVYIVEPPPRTITYQRFVVDLTTGAMPRLLQAPPRPDTNFAGEQLYLDTVPDLSLWTNNPGPGFRARAQARVLELSIAFPDKALDHLRSTATAVAGQAALTATRLRNLTDVGRALADRGTLLHNFIRMIMRSVEPLEEIVFFADPSQRFPTLPVALPGGGHLTGGQAPGCIVMSVAGTDWSQRLVDSAGVFDLGRAFALAYARWNSKSDTPIADIGAGGIDGGNKTKSSLRRPAATLLAEKPACTEAEQEEAELRSTIAKRKGRDNENAISSDALGEPKRAKVYKHGVDLFDDWLEEVIGSIPAADLLASLHKDGNVQQSICVLDA